MVEESGMMSWQLHGAIATVIALTIFYLVLVVIAWSWQKGYSPLVPLLIIWFAFLGFSYIAGF